MDRTTAYEHLQDHVTRLRAEVIPARTLSRAYADYAELLKAKSFSTVGDYARDDLAEYAKSQAKFYNDKANENLELAEKMEREGVPS